MKEECVKVKNMKITNIPIDICRSEEKIDALLKKGFVVNHSIETVNPDGGTKTVIKTYSPKTFQEAWEEHKKLRGPGIPF